MNDRKFSWQKILLWVIIFSIAMGFLETAVVVYLRHIYYPQGFKFPLAPIDTSLVVVEVGRELATIIMLLGVGAIAGRTFASRFAYFILSFAIWDIFYYLNFEFRFCLCHYAVIFSNKYMFCDKI